MKVLLMYEQNLQNVHLVFFGTSKRRLRNTKIKQTKKVGTAGNSFLDHLVGL